MTQTQSAVRGGDDSSAPARGDRKDRAPRPSRSLPTWSLPYFLLLPGLAVIAALLIYPLFQMVVMSFQKVGIRQVRGAPAEFVGTDNYRQILENPLFWSSLRNTVFFAVAAVSLTLILGTLVGLLIHRLGKKMANTVIVGIIAAWAVPPVAAAIIWRWLFDAEQGIINWALNFLPDWLSQLLFGRSDWTGEPWLNDPLTIYLVLVVMVVWQSFPFVAVSVLAGLKSIPTSLYEAARVDGATPVRIFRKITFPMLKPVFAVLTVLSIIWDFKVFGQLYVLMSGPTNRDALNLSLFSFAEAFRSPPKMGTGAAIAVVLTLILLIVTLIHIRQIVKQEDDIR
ncbi:carbohydrate ABC transporter permease [Rhizohabitans arisaemae]|uniref:carbohydrate ABC transporter permease n=1 Tax=Rhizohabitans arisaemae TaxID=2720610 RepID=UPI0024B1C376|nr:sugar ABC transporter permease [Rhizohabitans arisaemae]